MSYDLGKWREIEHQVNQFQQAKDKNSYFVAIKARGENGMITQVRCLSSNVIIGGFERLAIWFNKPKGTQLIYGRAIEDNAASKLVLDSLGRNISKASIARSDGDYVSFMQQHRIKQVDDISALEKKINDICAKHAALAKTFDVTHVTTPVSMDRERAILLDVQILLKELNQQADTILEGPKSMQQANNMLNLLQRYLGDTRFVEVLSPDEFSQLEKRVQQVMDTLVLVLEQEGDLAKDFDKVKLQVFQDVQRQFRELNDTFTKNVSQASSKSWAAQRLQTHCLEALNRAESSHFQTAVSHFESLIEAKKKEIEDGVDELKVRRDRAGEIEASAQAHRHQLLGAFNQFEATLKICSSPAFNSISDDLKGQLAAIAVKFDAYKSAIHHEEMTFDSFMTTDWLDSLSKDIDALSSAFAVQPLQGPEQKILTDQVERKQELEGFERQLEKAYDEVNKTQQDMDRISRFQLNSEEIKGLIDGFGNYVRHEMKGDPRATLDDLIRKMSDPSLSADELIGLFRSNIKFFGSHHFESPLKVAYNKLHVALLVNEEAKNARNAFLELREMMNRPGLTNEEYLTGIEDLQKKYHSPFVLLSYHAKKTLEAGREMLAADDGFTAQDADAAKTRLQSALTQSRSLIDQAAPKMKQMEKDLIDIFTYHKAIDTIDKLLPTASRRKEKDYSTWPDIHTAIEKLDAADRGIIQDSLRQIWSMENAELIADKVEGRKKHQERLHQLKHKLAEQQDHFKAIKKERDAIYEALSKLDVAYRALTKDRENKIRLLNSLLESLGMAKSHSESMTDAHRQVASCHFEISRIEANRQKLEAEVMQGHHALTQIRQAQTLEAFASHLRLFTVDAKKYKMLN